MNMKKLSIEYDNFKKIIETDSYIIDKTMLSELFDITKDSKDLFNDMKISNTIYIKYINQLC
jgi:hypothetical protein